MGRTIPSYRIATEIEKRKLKPFREALDKSERKDWLKETLVLIALIIVVSTLVAMFIPVPYSFPVTVGLVILIVWLIHRRSRYVPYSSKV